MSCARKASLFFLFPCALLLSAEGGVVLRAAAQPLESGPGGRFDLVISLENPQARAVVSYQLYVGYDAEALLPTGVIFPQEAAFSESPFAAGVFDGRQDVPFSQWRDSAGTDVVSVSALAPGGEPVTAGGVLVVIHFEVKDASEGSVGFTLDPGPYWSFSGLFDPEGKSVPVSYDLGQVLLSAIAPVRNLLCEVEHSQVILTWEEPVDIPELYRVERNGVLLENLGPEATGYRDETPQLGENVYVVRPVVGGANGPGLTCSVVISLPGPSNLVCTFDGASTRLRWDRPLDYSYQDILRNGAFLARVEGTAVEFVDTGDFSGLQVFTYEVFGVLSGNESEHASCRIDMTGGNEDFLRGDVNGDGRRVLSDAVAVLRYLFGGTAITCLDAADFDDNGRVQLGDVIGLLGWLFSGGAPPAPPAESPGPDPTADQLPCFPPQGV